MTLTRLRLAAFTCVLIGFAVFGGALYWMQPVPQSPSDTKQPVHPATFEVHRPPLFDDVTASSGLAFTYRNGEEVDLYTILESLGGGVALLDFDGDGLLDLYFPGGGTFYKGTPPKIVGFSGRLFRNLGNWKFRDVTDETGLSQPAFYSHGASVGDFDGDGWPDLLVTGYNRMVLYHNIPADKGGRRFVDVTARVGLDDTRWSTSAAWADFSGSGRLDLYVCRYLNWSFANDPHCPSKADPKLREVCEPQLFKPLPDSLYRFTDGKFVDISSEVGLRKDGKGLGVIVTDLNADGKPDLYVANDASNNFLYLNRGKGRFEEVGLTTGTAVDGFGRYNGSMGVDVGDYNGSGRASLWVTNFQGEFHALYLNLGQDQFLYQSSVAGLGALGQQYVGFGTGFLDLDNDGWLDLIIVNGHVIRRPISSTFKQRPVLLRNTERMKRRYFTDISPEGGSYFAKPVLGRGLAIGDLDNDGWPDVIISHCNTPVTLLRNRKQVDEERHWLGIQLVGKKGRSTIGATVRVECGNQLLTRFSRSGGSYLSSGDPRLLFGLGKNKDIRKVTVHWPWGTTQEFKGLTTDRYWELVEGDPKPRDVRSIRH